MTDLWAECFNPSFGDAKAFASTFCRVCRNPSCERSAVGQSLWFQRISTQVDRLLDNPQFAPADDPRHADVRGVDFPSALKEAMILEISDRKNDWNIPTEADARAIAATMSVTRPSLFQASTPDEVPPVQVDEVTRVEQVGDYEVRLVRGPGGAEKWECDCKAGSFGKPCKHLLVAKGRAPAEEPVQAPLPPAPGPTSLAPRGRAFMPSSGNIPAPPGGIMIDGSRPTPPRLREVPQPAVVDAWTAPKKKDVVTIPVGGKVVLGNKKEGN